MDHRVMTEEELARLERLASQIRVTLYAAGALACIAVGSTLGFLVYAAARLFR